jgi:hypothetical protein
MVVKKATVMIMPNWPAAMSRELALAYTGVARSQLQEWERSGTIIFLPLGPRGEKIALRSALDSVLVALFESDDHSDNFDFG